MAIKKRKLNKRITLLPRLWKNQWRLTKGASFADRLRFVIKITIIVLR